MSPKNSINSSDVKAAVRAVALAYVPVALVVLDAVSKGQYDVGTLKNIAVAAAVSTTLDILRRYLRGTNETQTDISDKP